VLLKVDCELDPPDPLVSVSSLHASTPAAVDRPSRSAAAVRGSVPSTRRSRSLQWGQLVSVAFAAQPHPEHVRSMGAMPRIVPRYAGVRQRAGALAEGSGVSPRFGSASSSFEEESGESRVDDVGVLRSQNACRCVGASTLSSIDDA